MRVILNIAAQHLRNAITQKYKQHVVAFSVFNSLKKNAEEEFESLNEDLLETDKEYEVLADRCFGHSTFHNCFIIYPYVKWGPRKVLDANPQQKIAEAIGLIRTLAPWKVHDTIAVPLPDLQRKALFGSGTLQKLKNEIRGNPSITAVFINTGMLRNIQLKELETQFGVPIYDRYKIVMQILRLHAISNHAKLQVALAELPYLQTRLKKEDFNIVTSDVYETRKLSLQNREQKLKVALKKLQSQRQLLRSRRTRLDYPVVAVVGYTNSGKTSLIKALTGDEKLQPINHLFATLDVTMHAGKLPSLLEVLYVDTVGFISDIPTTLIECFIVTLEDAMLADVIIHVEDMSNDNIIHQRNHVLLTLDNLATKTGSQTLLQKIITVGNKCDLPVKTPLAENAIAVSATTHQGIDRLRLVIEDAVLEATERKLITIRVSSGGDEMRWLYKNATVIAAEEDKQNLEFQNIKVIMTKSKLEQFKYQFIKIKK